MGLPRRVALLWFLPWATTHPFTLPSVTLQRNKAKSWEVWIVSTIKLVMIPTKTKHHITCLSKCHHFLPSVIAQNDTSLPVTTFPWFRHMSTLPWWHFMKFTEKTPNLEDPYLEFCNIVLSHLSTIGKVSESDKTFQKPQSLKIPKSTLKMSLFYLYVIFLKETHVWYVTWYIYYSCMP